MLKYYNRVYQFFFHGFCSKFSDQHFYITSPVGCFSSTEATGALRDCDLDCHKHYSKTSFSMTRRINAWLR